ncbi:MAG: sigma 54-interacting transcriptional regulator [Firmicutes bacterium]|nr:sigma 54-interacting transcriptional regulator [Bacillota bacterium]
MSKLLLVQDAVQQICSAITSVLNVESMVLDENLQIIAGTGKYEEQIGSLEAEALLSEEYLYKYILRVGGTYVADDISDPLYGPEQYGETGEICCAIPYRTGSIGILSLVAFDEEQYDRLIGNSANVCDFLSNMALLLSSYLAGSETLGRIDAQARLLTEVVDSSPHCIIAVDAAGKIVNANTKARNFLQPGSDRFWGVLGKKIDQFWKGALAAIIGQKQDHRNKEFVFNNGEVHIILSSRIIYNEGNIEQIVIFFDDVVEAKENAYALLDDAKGSLDSIIGSSAALSEVKRMVPAVSSSDSTVLITGESGVGKELFARAIHFSGPRSSAPFVTINCGVIPENLMESELFGFEKGSFTGANEQGHIGKFEKANGGTVFIDEIGDLPLHLQMKLLRVLQSKEFERVGGTQTIHVDVRFIAATNRDLTAMIREGAFREDLYYRLNVIPMYIPPLREHPEDIPALIHHFLSRYAARLRRNVKAVSDDAMSFLTQNDWPGNVRELENVIEYGVNMAQGNMIRVSDLPPYLKKARPDLSMGADSGLKQNIENYENYLLIQQLKEVEEGRLTKEELARKLGISRSSLYRRINRLTKSK